MGQLEDGRHAFQRRAWDEAFDLLSTADEHQPLPPADLESLAICAALLGKDASLEDLWTRAHHGYADAGDLPRSARAAFWLGMNLVQRGEMARGGGWLARAQRVLEENALDVPERGLTLVPMALQALYAGDPASASEMFRDARGIAERFGDRDLLTLSMVGGGQALIAQGLFAEGAALHDEVMVAVTAAEVSPIVAGIAYCAVIEACQAAYDVRRAREWTDALTRWCESQPSLVPFRGQCLVHRAEILQLNGAWGDALMEAERACVWLTTPLQAAAGMAFYQLGELHRVRGRTKEAEEAYTKASEVGHSPQPGLALLRLQQGRLDVATAAIERLIEETRERAERSRLLPAHVEIMIAAGALDRARGSAEELSVLAAEAGERVPFLAGLAAHARGHVRLAEGDARGAIASLREATAAWRQIDAVHALARTRILMARACEQIGDIDTASMERQAAIRAFTALGAEPDLAAAGGEPARATELTDREVEVLRLIASGMTNRAIAGALSISEKTAARHVSNILMKLGLPSRAAATAYAYEQNLIESRPT